MLSRVDYINGEKYRKKQKEVIEKLHYNVDNCVFSNEFKLFVNFIFKLQKTLDAHVVVTGGPGTGKTLFCKCINEIIKNYEYSVKAIYEEDVFCKREVATKEVVENVEYLIIDGFQVLKENINEDMKRIITVPKINYISSENIQKIGTHIHIQLDRVSLYVPGTIEVDVIKSPQFI